MHDHLLVGPKSKISHQSTKQKKTWRNGICTLSARSAYRECTWKVFKKVTRYLLVVPTSLLQIASPPSPCLSCAPSSSLINTIKYYSTHYQYHFFYHPLFLSSLNLTFFNLYCCLSIHTFVTSRSDD